MNPRDESCRFQNHRRSISSRLCEEEQRGVMVKWKGENEATPTENDAVG